MILDNKKIVRLLEDKVPESKTIEYKEKEPGGTNGEKKEFLADVSSFANALGGDIIYGIKEDSGIPISIEGLPEVNIDSEILRLENIIRDGISPRISGLSIYPIDMDEGKLLVVHMPKSWASPHMVSFQGGSKFFNRNSAGKYQLDVGEIRSSFLLSDSISQKTRNFRYERLSIIESEEIPVNINDKSKLILHIVPFNAFDSQVNYNLNLYEDQLIKTKPLNGGGGWNYSYCFDGFMTFSERSAGAYAYSLFFRNGIIEAITDNIFHIENEQPMIIGYQLEKAILSCIPPFLSIQKLLGVDPPLMILISLLGVKGHTMYFENSRYMATDLRTIERSSLLIPDVLIENFDIDPQKMLKPSFDCVWNACGMKESVNFDKEGNWH